MNRSRDLSPSARRESIAFARGYLTLITREQPYGRTEGWLTAKAWPNLLVLADAVEEAGARYLAQQLRSMGFYVRNSYELEMVHHIPNVVEEILVFLKTGTPPKEIWGDLKTRAGHAQPAGEALRGPDPYEGERRSGYILKSPIDGRDLIDVYRSDLKYRERSRGNAQSQAFPFTTVIAGYRYSGVTTNGWLDRATGRVSGNLSMRRGARVTPQGKTLRKSRAKNR
jgi:hypothetical protein